MQYTKFSSEYRLPSQLTMKVSDHPGPLISVIDTSPQDWKYVSEGGAHIVFSYAGDPYHPYFGGMVLRLRKVAGLTTTDDPNVPVPSDIQDDFCECDDKRMEFQHRIIERLIPPNYLPRLTPVCLERGWLQDLANLRDSDRPSDRRKKDRIDVTKTKAALATDLVGYSALVVEIKVSGVFDSHLL
jgi:inositol-pentakisphosphate 2-kinase